MTLNKQIYYTAQQIGAIFVKKNIKCIPVHVRYLEREIDPTNEIKVISEMLLSLDALLKRYARRERKQHKIKWCFDLFVELLNEHSDNKNVIGVTI